MATSGSSHWGATISLILLVIFTGDDDDFGDYISTDDVDDNTASAGGVQLEDEDAFELGSGHSKAERKAAAGMQGQAEDSKKQKVSQIRSAGDTDETTPVLVEGDALAAPKKKKKVGTDEYHFIHDC